MLLPFIIDWSTSPNLQAGLGSVGECGKVLFLPTCSLTHHIGLTTDAHSVVIHVIFVLDGSLYSGELTIACCDTL